MKTFWFSQPRRMKEESGLYIVLVAVMLFMLIGLIVLVVGLGAIGTNKTRLQNAANSAALAALEGYINADPGLSHGDKAAVALTRANKVLGANKMPGVEQDLGDLALAPAQGAGGMLEFGMWFAKAPNPSQPNAHCSAVYPCFESYNGTTVAEVNSAKVDIKNQSNNPLVISIAGMLGRSDFFLAANSTAALSPRCVAYLMDVSGSSQYETHPKGGTQAINFCSTSFPGNPGMGIPAGGCDHPSCSGNLPSGTCLPTNAPCETPDQCLPGGIPAKFYPSAPDGPNHVGLGFILADQLTGLDCGNLSQLDSRDRVVWCNYKANRTGVEPSQPFRHARDDYFQSAADVEQANVAGSTVNVLVDKLYMELGDGSTYEGPQPLTRNFLAFNAGLRIVQATASPGDLSVVMAFTSGIRDRYPEGGAQGELTRDLGFLIQLTNTENRGMRRFNGDTSGLPPEVHPNFIDRGWFPVNVAGGNETNIVEALLTAANALHSTCLPTSRKAIVLATDGVSTCSRDTASGNAVCDDTYARYLAAEGQLLRDPVYTGSPPVPSILQRLLDWEISLTTILDSTGVGPNFYNIRTYATGCDYSGTVQPTDPKCYMSYEEARALGYGGIDSFKPYFDSSSLQAGNPVGDQDAHESFGQPGYVFGRPMGALGQLSMRTGGFMCGILQPGTPGMYEDFFGDRGGAACNAPCNTTQYKCSPCVLKGEYRTASCNPEGRGGAPTTTCTRANAQEIATEYLSRSQQAARCVANTVGLNPFMLVARDTE